MSSKKVGLLIVLVSLSFMACQSILRATEPSKTGEEIFLEILNAAYRVSCQDVDALRKYYLMDAEIINNGRQGTLEEMVKELKKSLSSLSGLSCSYQPMIRASRINEELAYIVVREIIQLSAREVADQQIQQLCTYVFLKTGSSWKIAHDHCSTVPGLAI